MYPLFSWCSNANAYLLLIFFFFCIMGNQPYLIVTIFLINYYKLAKCNYVIKVQRCFRLRYRIDGTIALLC